jgi:stearoyl-CoA desaturase (delta-9 desaturase)
MLLNIAIVVVAVCASQWVLGFANTVGFHRLLTHRSFKAPSWVRNGFALTAAQFSGSPMLWVGMHRVHHQVSDTDRDPHTPTRGFWFAHCGWLIKSRSPLIAIPFAILGGIGVQAVIVYYDIKRLIGKHPPVWRKLTRDLGKERFMRFLDTPLVITAMFAAQVAAAWLIAGWWGLAYLWGVHFVHLNSSWAVNSLCHWPTFGQRDHETKEQSRNVHWLAPITLGESHHNSHHRYPKSAKHALIGGMDPSWRLIRILERLGLAWDVNLPAAYREVEVTEHARQEG